MTHKIVTLRRDQIEAAADMLAWAFDYDPIYSVLFPSSQARHKALANMFAGVVGYALHYGEVLTTPELRGVACWLPPGYTEVTPWRIIRTGFCLARGITGLDKATRRRFMAGIQHTEAVHKRLMPGPHWYLWLLGVSPDRQGHGYGSALLRPIFPRADEAGVPCYLETQTRQNVAFYRRRGFEVAETGSLPGVDLPVWVMIRPPQT